MRYQLSVLRVAPFRRLLLSRTCSLLGNSAAPIALAFAVLRFPGNAPANLGIVLLGRSAAQIVFLLLGGVLADRLPRYWLMVTAELVAGLSQSVAAGLVLSGTAGVASLTALSAVNGAAAAMFFPASAGIMPQLLPKDQLQPANALLGAASNGSTILGAALASVVVAGFGPGWALAMDALSFLVSAVLLTGTKVSRVERLTRTSVLADLRQGWWEFASRPWVWVVVAQFAVLNACSNGVFRVLGPIVAASRLGGAAAWGAIVTTQSVGYLVGSAVSMRVRPRHPIRVAVLVTFGFTPSLWLMAAGAPTVAIAASGLVSGICGMTFGVLWSTSLQTKVPLESLSRLSSYDALGSFILGPVALAAIGPIAGHFGVVPTLYATGGLMLVVSAAGLLSRQVRTLTLDEPVSADVVAE
jgi:hypothetical protein